ncbi:superinfection immunity protein [Cellulomonas sp. KRMCY2]|uniref:superinfection immunity protein n=1 Tax=Cellulomonas sp. KRMCY2 TaxID=1304865 RepID=UPI0004B99502|nr:superinfection immunity protein [Cellulomonas sp. KRMCY2]
MTDQRPIDTGIVIVAWVLTVLTGGYLLPWAVAATRGKADAGSIALINVLLGWTVIGWIAAVVLACMPHRIVGPAPGVPVVWPPVAGWYAAPDGYGRQWWDGAAWTDHRAP